MNALRQASFERHLASKELLVLSGEHTGSPLHFSTPSVKLQFFSCFLQNPPLFWFGSYKKIHKFAIYILN